MTPRFTIDGSPELESSLAGTCDRVGAVARRIIPGGRLGALVLGGGYGRGHGGVLKTPEGDQPYNDLEFYVFTRGNRLADERRYAGVLGGAETTLSQAAGLHIEFKLESLERLQRAPVSMFSYDMVSRHRVVLGEPDFFRKCEDHREAAAIPSAEATRLLFNRCTGLLLCRERFQKPGFGPAEGDFVYRNIAKAWLALGDAILALRHQYHWDCRERQRRLRGLTAAGDESWFKEVVELHDRGIKFKLYPLRTTLGAEELEALHAQASQLALKVWLWLESQRLGCSFSTPRDYCLSRVPKCEIAPAWRNYLLNVKMFGGRPVFDRMAWRYPRERLLNSLPLLLWNGSQFGPAEARHLQAQLRTPASDWGGFVDAYKTIWARYG